MTVSTVFLHQHTVMSHSPLVNCCGLLVMLTLTCGFGLLAISWNQQINGPNSCSLAAGCIFRANIITCQQSLINTREKY